MSLIKNNFIINSVIDFFKKIKLKSLYGFSLYELFNLYFIGIIKGAISTRASSISFSFFMAFSPALPYVKILN